MERENKKTGEIWSKILKIEIINPKGWRDDSQFNKEYITKEEFCNRAINSEIKPKLELTRRNAAKLFKKNLNV